MNEDITAKKRFALEELKEQYRLFKKFPENKEKLKEDFIIERNTKKLQPTHDLTQLERDFKSKIDAVANISDLEYEELKQIAKKDLEFEEATKDYKIIEDEEPDIWDFDKKGNRRLNIDKCSNYLREKFIFKTISERDSFQIYLYRDIFSPIGNGFVKVEIEKLIGENCNNFLVSEILAKIQRKTFIEREDFERTPIHLIPFKNGCYNVKTKQLEPYKPEYNFKHKLNAFYIKGMDCLQFKKYLEETLYPEDLDLIQELFGFCLYRKYFLKKGFIFVGEKNTGKTTLINILVSLIGIKNCSGLSLQKIGLGKSFDLSSLYEKYLNFYDDLSTKDLLENAGFKIATGGGYITAEKKFGDLFQFMSYAKLIFATNKIPPIKDLDDDALFIRNIIFQFDNEVSENDIDPNLTDRLTTDEELSGVVNWSLEGLHRLLENSKFSYNKTIEEVKTIMCKSGNPLFSFVSDVLKQKDDSKITKEQMFEIYKIYANENKISPLSKEQLGRQLQKIAPWIANKRDKERYWENVSIVSNYLNNKKVKSILDTLDTSQNNTTHKEKSNNIPIDMFFQKVSNPSKEPTTQETKICESCSINPATKELFEVNLCQECFEMNMEGSKDIQLNKQQEEIEDDKD